MINFKSEQRMLEWLKIQFNFYKNISIILDKERLYEILDSIDFEVSTFWKEIDSEHYTYLINKFENEEGINIYVLPIDFENEGCVGIENDYVIVQEGLLEQGDLDNIYAAEELIIVDYEYDGDFEEEDDCESLVDLIEEYATVIEATDGCPYCIREKLVEFAFDLLQIEE